MSTRVVRTAIPKHESSTGYVLRGDNRRMVSCRTHESVLSGPSDTGKTVACCVKLHLVCLLYPGANCLMARKTQKSLTGTVLRTFDRVVANQGVDKYGGASPNGYHYPNGSRVALGGMDNTDKFLSAEFDCVYVNQAEELSEAEWETLGSRATGRGKPPNVAKWCQPQVFGDCNPSGRTHWIRRRGEVGKLWLGVSTHKDNPELYSAKGEVTDEGRKRLDALESTLSGVRKQRLLKGIWATVEGAVYEDFSVATHVRIAKPAEVKRWLMCQDEGFTNPAVILLVGEDSDGRWHVFKEFYERRKLQSEVVTVAKAWFLEERNGLRPEVSAVDKSAAGLIADLQSAGVNAIASTAGGDNTVRDGIFRLIDRVAVQKDGKPRLTVDPSCANTINEFESYRWDPAAVKEKPIKEDDHAMDALRYLSDVTSVPTGAFVSADGIFTGKQAERLEVSRLGPGDW